MLESDHEQVVAVNINPVSMVDRRDIVLKRLYIDNFRCFSNFELSLDSMDLLLGANGSGKSTIFDVLAKVQNFVAFGQKVERTFSEADITRWSKLKVQRFELSVKIGDDVYLYELTIEFKGEGRPRAQKESLTVNGSSLLQRQHEQVKLYRDDFSLESAYPMEDSLSAIALLPTLERNQRITTFRDYLANQLLIVQINPIPLVMKGQSDKESPRLDRLAANFVSWYRYISQDQGLTFEIVGHLKNVLDGFSHFEFLTRGEQARSLCVHFFSEESDKMFSYPFEGLSDGQRVLIVLYTLLTYSRRQRGTLCIDEPENYIALPEIQPWLFELNDANMDGALQALMISHHPELIDYLAPFHGVWFERQPNGPVRIRSMKKDNGAGLPLSELVARGWINA